MRPVADGSGKVSGIDRRVRRTRALLQAALVDLIIERGYQRISVQDILDGADVGRSTFYAHFRDKDALLLSAFDDVRAGVQADIDALRPGVAPHDLAQPSRALFRHAYANRTVYRAICSRHSAGTVVQRQLQTMLGDIIGQHLAPHLAAAKATLPADLVSECYASALVASLTWCVEHDFPHDPLWMARAYGSLTAPGILGALGHRHPSTATASSSDHA
jgi:AcrR family transcriptional regulator